MKNFISAVIVVTVLLTAISCSKQQEETVKPDITSLKAQYEQLSKTPGTESGSISDMSKSFITGLDSKKLDLLKQINRLSGVHMMGWNGPFTVTGTLRLIATNQEVFISNTDAPTLASGIYLCNVYVVSAELTLPADAIAKIELAMMPKYGYSNWTTKLRGVAYNQAVGPTGNIVAMATYDLLARYNIAGQAVSAPAIPAGDLTGMQFVYSYFQ